MKTSSTLEVLISIIIIMDPGTWVQVAGSVVLFCNLLGPGGS